VVVVPTYNEVENIEELIERVAAAAPGVDLLIVDDASPDGTADLAERLCARHAGFRVYRRSGPRGLGRAYQDAICRMLAEGYTRIAQMDADLSHDPAYLPTLLAAAETADLVIGSRYVRGGGVRDWPLHRVLLSRYANVYVRLITGVPTADATAGFRCWTARGLEALNLSTLTSEGYAFAVEMTFRAYRAGLRIAETPIVFTDRRLGQSKMSGHVIRESILMPWRLRLFPPR
jgi:dolichol-phosphate mannosyltransferase